MKFKSCLTGLIVGLSLSGCGKGSSSGNPSPETTSTTNGEPTETYYRNYYQKFAFLAHECNKDNWRTYEFASTHNNAPVDRAAHTYMDFDLYLLAGDRYIAIIERKTPSPQFGPNSYQILKRDRVEGTWQVVEEELILNGLGSGRPMKYNEADSVYFTTSGVTAHPEYNEKELFITGAGSSSVLEELEQQCP